MSEEKQAKIINRTMSSESWKSEVLSFPVEWQVRAESAMAKALGHGLYEGCKDNPNYAVFDTLDRLYREGFEIRWPARFEDEHPDLFVLVDITDAVVISGSSFRDLCVNIVLAGL